METMITRSKDEACCIIPRKDPNYEANMIKVTIDNVIKTNTAQEKVRLSLDYNERHSARRGKRELKKRVRLGLSDAIEFVPIEEKWRGSVKVSCMGISGERAGIKIGYNPENYAVHRIEVFNCITKENKPRQF